MQMLQIQHICKEYKTGKFIQKALDDVSLNLRENEFVAILGPSGSGKTTLLNIIGGLDRYDSGDLVINGISTKKYKDRDWDSYRNHTIGFVFQSYNLIPHQSVLANVELALTISGIGKAERRERAKAALEEVGLGEQLHKKPNQMSGGQMQRVAIARALVNDPDILLADEPTGALDSDTSIQVMELLKKVAKDRLVVMVTHNPELAEDYATRIVTLRDGKIRSDTNPFEVDEKEQAVPEHKNMGRSSMSFLTALSLSFHNLRTKKARTLLTSFAGSIGIIGIALILALSAGVDAYIKSIEEDTLSEYPVQIQSTGVDVTSMMMMESDGGTEKKKESEINVIDMVTNMFSKMNSNDLTSLKAYLDSSNSGIDNYAKSVEYGYGITPQIYRIQGDSVRQVHPDKSFSSLGLGSASGSNNLMSAMMSTNVFYEMPECKALYEKQYDVKAGRWPEKETECVLVLTGNGDISDFMLYTLGLRNPLELDEMIRQFIEEEPVVTPELSKNYSYREILGTTFKLVNAADYYQYDREYHVWKDKSNDDDYMKKIVESGENLEIVGIVQPSDDANSAILMPGIAYPHGLALHVAENAANSQIVKEQLAEKETDVFTKKAFGAEVEEKTPDMNSLFSVDENALKQVFGFDENVLSGGLERVFRLPANGENSNHTLDLSGMIDFKDLSIKLPDHSPITMDEILENLDITITPEQLKQMSITFLEGYKAYVAAHPEADYSHLGEQFLTFLQTAEAKQILAEHIQNMIESGGSITVSKEQLQQLIRDVMSGYEKYAQENQLTDPDKFDEYLIQYLQTPQAQQILNAWAEEHLKPNGDITILPEQLEALAKALVNCYSSYAAENHLPDPGRMEEHFLAYLSTDQAKEALMTGISGMIDTGKLESVISSSLKEYMEEVMKSYSTGLSEVIQTQAAAVTSQIIEQIAGSMKSTITRSMNQLSSMMEQAVTIDGEAFLNAFQMKMTGEELAELLLTTTKETAASYENNLKRLGYVEFDEPVTVSIYPKDFESKEEVVQILNTYNERMEDAGKEEQVITYTDMVGTLMSSVTDIIDVISYVLIAFVAISLIVSSIMIGVITYISVLERKKEIGILRAIGASKNNISQVFNAETFIIGLGAGIIGIGLTLLMLIPGNALIHHLAGTDEINAVLPVIPAVILVLLSVILTLLGGLLPSRKAAKSDPVTALRTE